MAKIKWGAGLKLFLLMFITTIAFFIPSIASDMSRRQTGLSEFLRLFSSSYYFFYIFLLFCSLLFILSLFYIDKKIEGNNYIFSKLLRYNLSIVVVLYLLGIVISIFSNEALHLAILFGPVIFLLFVLIFSFIPALIYKKFINNENFFRILKIIYLIVLSIVLILSFTGAILEYYFTNRTPIVNEISY